MDEIIVKQEYLRPPTRYTEASLVKKLEALGIGRPSTYANTIKTIQQREYIKVDNIPGIKKEIVTFTIKSKNGVVVAEINEESNTVLLGKETKKLVPTKLGITVNNYLLEHFPELMDYKFTAKMEEELDAVASGDKIWHKVVKKFYDKLNPIIIKLSNKKGIASSNEKLLGTDKSGAEIFATSTKYGPAVKKLVNGKFLYASIGDSFNLETINLKEAIKLLKEREAIAEYPKIIGQFNKKDIALNKGKFGYYVIYDGDNYSFPPETKYECTLNEAIELIKAKKANYLAEFELVENKKNIKAVVLNGKYGPYIMVKRGKTKTNYPLYGKSEPDKLTKKQVLEIISKKKATEKKSISGSKTAKKNIPSKKTVVGSKTTKKTVVGSKTTKKTVVGSKTTKKTATSK